MTLRDTEVAEAIIDESIDAQALVAAKDYPDLMIVCLRCRPQASVRGSDYAAHMAQHKEQIANQYDIPSHWMAL